LREHCFNPKQKAKQNGKGQYASDSANIKELGLHFNAVCAIQGKERKRFNNVKDGACARDNHQMRKRSARYV
jgi:hypothetical protein